MSTGGLKPIDASTMKPGDPVVKRNGIRGKLHSVIEAADPSYQAVILWDNGVVHGYTLDGKRFVGTETVAFLPPDPDPVDPSPGNVDKLRKSQVGEGWRIPAHDEKPDRRAKWWARNRNKWEPRAWHATTPYQVTDTYRVPIAPIRMVPLSVEDFVGKPWPRVRLIGSVNEGQVQGFDTQGIYYSGDTRRIAFETLRQSFELSHDHGVTWVKAEKEEQV